MLAPAGVGMAGEVSRMGKRRVMVIGLDCAEPSLAFDRYASGMPNLRRLMKRGCWGPLRSTIPPITVPAWTCMVSGADPGELGIYGFRNRKAYDTYEMDFATAKAVHVPRLWDVLGDAGLTSTALFVPQTYPPAAIRGSMVSCFLTPGADSDYARPPELKKELESTFGPYIVDVPDFRTDDKDRLLESIYTMSGQHFGMARHLLARSDWDFFMMVDMGCDRFHHGFWKYIAADHPQHVPGNRWVDTGRDYYAYLDREIGTLLDLIDDRTAVLVVSDHGAQRMDGSICINDFLIQKGLLALKEPTTTVTRLKNLSVDWPNTKAWGWGGYVSRVFLNVKGREAQGAVEPADYERTRDELIALLKAIPDDKGRPMRTQCFKPNEIYSLDHIEQAPDLIVYFDDLFWRATEDVGHDSIWSFETEVGPDDAMHAQHGMHILTWPGARGGIRDDAADLIDGAPTILDLLGIPIPDDMEGRSLVQ